MRRLHRIAEFHANLPYKSEEARDIVADAITSVVAEQTGASGDALRRELRRAVRRQAERATSKKALAGRFVFLDDLPEHHLASASESPLENPDATSPKRNAPGIVARIRALAAGDTYVLQLLEALVTGERRARDPRRFGITPRTYRSARERLEAYAVLAAAMPGSGSADADGDDGGGSGS